MTPFKPFPLRLPRQSRAKPREQLRPFHVEFAKRVAKESYWPFLYQLVAMCEHCRQDDYTARLVEPVVTIDRIRRLIKRPDWQLAVREAEEALKPKPEPPPTPRPSLDDMVEPTEMQRSAGWMSYRDWLALRRRENAQATSPT